MFSSSKRSRREWALLDGKSCLKQTWPTKIPSFTNSSEEEDASTELLGIIKGGVLFLQAYIWLGFKCYEMLLIRTKCLNLQFYLVPNKANGEFWLWLKVVWGLFDMELILAEIERKTFLSFPWTEQETIQEFCLALKTTKSMPPFLQTLVSNPFSLDF